jgi:hypothetical protein
MTPANRDQTVRRRMGNPDPYGDFEDGTETHQDQKKNKALEAYDVGGHDADSSLFRLCLSCKTARSDVIAITQRALSAGAGNRNR